MKTDIVTRQKAVRKVLSDLDNTIRNAIITDSMFGFALPDNKRRTDAKSTAALFLADMKKGEHTEWDLYKHAVGIVKGLTAKGRPTPIKTNPHSSGGNTRMAAIVGGAYIASRNGKKYCPTLPLAGCKTDVARAKLILRANIPDQVKMDLISVLNL